MQSINLTLVQLYPATWNANRMDGAAIGRLRESLARYGMVQNLVVRKLANANYEVLSGNQRLTVLRDLGYAEVPCVLVELDDARARLLAQALNRIQGEDDLGLRAELIRQVLEALPQEDVLSLLPETAESLKTLVSLGQGDMASYLQTWQKAQEARLKHLQFQLTPSQLEVVEEALSRLLPQAKRSQGESPNARGTALYLLCKNYLEGARV